ncbi:MAG: MFS transporter [Myxococcota bacterium]|nr:MFS transporter [Myxococcota bacterium]
MAWSVALAATFTMTVSYIDRTTFSVLALSVTKDLGISETAYGWLTSAFNIAYLIATPLAGWWIDRVGARRGLVWSVLVWTAVAALHAVVPGFAVLFVLRLALGIAEGPSFPGAAQTVQRVLPASERERGFGVLFTGSSIGGMIAPLLASALFALAGWRLAFVGTALAGLVWVPIWLWVTRSPEVRAQLDQAPVAADRAPHATFRELVAHPVMVRALLAVFAVAPIAGFSLGWGSKFLGTTFGVTQAQVGQYLWIPPLMFDAGAILFGDLASRQQRPPGTPPRLLFSIAVPLAASLALLPFATTPWTAMVILGTAMVGAGAIYTFVAADLLSRVPPASVSFAGGIMAGAQSLALIAMGPLVGYSVEIYAGYEVATTVIGALVLPGCIAWLLWLPRAFR